MAKVCFDFYERLPSLEPLTSPVALVGIAAGAEVVGLVVVVGPLKEKNL